MTKPKSLNLDINRLKSDFANYYAPNLLKIRNKDGQVTPFTMNRVQKKVNALLERHIKRHRTFFYILKARQTGISTWAEGRLFHLTHMFSNARNVIIANDYDGSENVYNMSKMYYDNLPVEYRPLTKYSSKKQLVFENPSKEGRISTPGMRSKIDVMTAGRQTSGRSFTFSAMHLSEFAFFPHGHELLTSLVPALPTRPGHFVIMETTANGTNNFAYNEWKRYKEMYQKYGDETEFLPIFIAWYDDEGYTKPFIEDKQRRQFKQGLSKEDTAMQKQFSLSLEQMHWRRTQIDAMGGDEERFAQEYPSTDEEAFLTSGKPIFNLHKIRLASAGIKKPEFTGEIRLNGQLDPGPVGRFRIWHAPKAGREYVLGVDPVVASEANVPRTDQRADNAVIQVIDKETLTQCAEWVARINPIGMAPYVREIGRYYGGKEGEALVVPERNNPGNTLIYELQKDYWNIYRAEQLDKIALKFSDKLGWDTNMRTKPLLIDFAAFCFHKGYAKLNSQELLDEMRTFVDDETSGSADGSARDDRVMAWMLALFVAGRGKSAFAPHLQQEASEPGKPTIEKLLSERTDAACIDVDEWRARQGKTSQDRYKSANVSWQSY